MNYLDEEILVKVNFRYAPTVDTIAKYVVYDSPNTGHRLLFEGSCYIPAGATSKTLRLNTIVEDYKFVNNLSIGTINDATGLIMQPYVGIMLGNTTYFASTEVMTIYRYPRLNEVSIPIIESTPAGTISLLQGYSTATKNYKLRPRIPFGANVVFPIVFGSDSSQVIVAVVDDGSILNSHSYTPANGYKYINNTIYSFTQSVVPDKGKTYTLELLDTNNGLLAPICDLDVCASEFYLIWQDRLGGTQSQPFGCTSKFGETITRDEIVNVNNTRSISNVVSQPTFTINSGWLDYKLLPYYESLFVSPWLQLYDTKNGVAYNVILTDNTYDQATFASNGHTMFNYTLNLEVAKKQNILW